MLLTLQAAIETARMPLAPSLALFSVPSSSIIFWSIATCWVTSVPCPNGNSTRRSSTIRLDNAKLGSF